MGSLKAIFIISFVGAAVSLAYATEESCDFTGINIHGAFKKILQKLTAATYVGSESFRPVFGGLEVGSATINGLNKIRQYGPLLPYCINGARMLQVDLIASSGAEISGPWRHCSGAEGSIKFRSSLVRMTAQLRVNVSESNQEVFLSYGGPLVPVTTQGVLCELEGAGDIAKQASIGLSLVLSTGLQQLWNNMFYARFDVMFYNTLQENIA
ncbi:uncharacterized protein LOC144132867 [Amblyomma americanum]